MGKKKEINGSAAQEEVVAPQLCWSHTAANSPDWDELADPVEAASELGDGTKGEVIEPSRHSCFSLPTAECVNECISCPRNPSGEKTSENEADTMIVSAISERRFYGAILGESSLRMPVPRNAISSRTRGERHRLLHGRKR